MIKSCGAKVVHLNNSIASQMYGALAAGLTGTKCVCSHRDYTYPSRLLQFLEGYVEWHVVCSKTIKSHLVDVLGISEAKIAYIYDPVDIDLFSPKVPRANLEDLFGVPAGGKSSRSSAASFLGRVTVCS